MKSLVVPAEIIISFPPQVKVTPNIAQLACFICEQHLNHMGMIDYKGPMIETGALSFGLRVHMKDLEQIDMVEASEPPSSLELLK